MAEYIEREFNPCDVCNYKRCGNCILHELAMKFVGHPAADVVEVRHGRWVEECVVDFNKAFCSIFVCSNCGKKYRIPKMNYCPDCGARMRGDNDEQSP